MNTLIFAIPGAIAMFAGVHFTLLAIEKTGETKTDPSKPIFWGVVGVWSLIGLLVGFLARKIKNICIYCMGAMAGYFITHMILSIGNVHIKNEKVYWGIMAVGSFGMCLVTCSLRKIIEIILTSIIGSYLFLYGLSAFFGGFPTRELLE